MEFFTSFGEGRPVRLCETTRRFAFESLKGKYGDEAMAYYGVSLDSVEGFETMSPLDRYDAAINCIARMAPLRFGRGELVSGSASLGLAIFHKVPCTYKGGVPIDGVSHLTAEFSKLLKIGLEGYIREIDSVLERELDAGQRRLVLSIKNTAEAFVLWHGRYLKAVEELNPAVYRNLKNVPLRPAANFWEAVQTVWMEFAFLRLCGVWPGIGRLDVLLGDYLRRDLEKGVLTLDDAREILASMFIKGCEWIRSDPGVGSGDAQHYQNIVLGGIDEHGREVTNEVTYLVLDIVEELAISDFPITVRVNENTPERLLKRVAEVIRHGGGIVAVYNEPLILKSLKQAGYPDNEAAGFANDGCWEVQIPGHTCFSYIPFDGLRLFEEAAGLRGGEVPDISSTEELYSLFKKRLGEEVENIYRGTVEAAYSFRDGRWRGNWIHPCSVVDLFEEDCLENAAGYYDLGPRYTVRSPHIGGAPDVANSLVAINELVFKKQLVSFAELAEILKNNWEGREDLRLTAKNGVSFYGNDSDEADEMMARILNDFADTVKSVAEKHSDCPVKFVPGVSTFGRQIEWRNYRMATAFGCRAGEILSGNASPTPGTDAAGLTAVVKSHCKADLCRQTSGAALDLRIAGSALAGEKGLNALVGLIRAFVKLGGYFMQADTVSAEVLRAAAENPEMFKTLSVRVSGWNARFVTLNREWQEMVINRTEQGM
ncbi:MAG: hypothetical protein IKZ19_10145 [Clostridia bacterium]|nr:hypothetical protein [Clostridia bacterium]